MRKTVSKISPRSLLAAAAVCAAIDGFLESCSESPAKRCGKESLGLLARASLADDVTRRDNVGDADGSRTGRRATGDRRTRRGGSSGARSSSGDEFVSLFSSIFYRI